MKGLISIFILVCGFLYLSAHDMIPTIEQIKGIVNLEQSKGKIETLIHENVQEDEGAQVETSSTPTPSASKYEPTDIQTYRVTVENGKIVITGKVTPYGKYNHAAGVILYIEEQRANKKVTLKVPFSNGKIHYEYPLSYNVGDFVLNLDEYYNGKTNDPNKVLGYAQYRLTDGNPYLVPSYMVQSDHPSVKSLARSITNGKKNDLEKSRAIFEWVAKNISYNAPLVDSPKPPLYSALDTYQKRVVLCSGYADLSAALHRAVGIEAKVSYGENHAWNEVKINGAWQREDPTYGSGYIDARSRKFVHSYQPAYFSKTDKNKEGEYPW